MNIASTLVAWMDSQSSQDLTILALEWCGTIAGLTGAFLLAAHTRVSKYGWVGFALANIFTAIVAFYVERYGILAQQVGFMFTSTLGLYKTGLLPWKPQVAT